ncbi:MAG TPA: NAD-dependent epimerase/dehydratase family protein [bacterium]|jgi:dihydroflavonol-4-reductase|nr:NAD-dependent epimerase/dehydratase family protein [bacterium]
MSLTLVTGANGHLGSRIVRKLLERGRRVRALVRANSNLRGLEEQGALLPGLELVRGDMLEAASLDAALRGVDRVFHTAAVFDTRLADESVMQKANVGGTYNLIQALRAHPVERLVHTSSVAAIGYSRDPSVVLDESTWNTDPIDVYTASKTESERLVQAAVKAGLPAVVVNPATVLGPGDHKPTPSNAFILLALSKGAPVTFNSGHTYVDADDVAEGHLLAEEKGRVGERYVLGGSPQSNDALLADLAKRRGGRPPFVHLGHASVEVLGWAVELKAKVTRSKPLFTRAKAHKLIDYYGYFSHAKAASELGYSPRPLPEVLDRAVAWYRSQGWLATPAS